MFKNQRSYCCKRIRSQNKKVIIYSDSTFLSSQLKIQLGMLPTNHKSRKGWRFFIGCTINGTVEKCKLLIETLTVGIHSAFFFNFAHAISRNGNQSRDVFHSNHLRYALPRARTISICTNESLMRKKPKECAYLKNITS